MAVGVTGAIFTNTINLGVSDRGFTGHKMLAKLKLIHMMGRVYDPTIGRFLSADPHIQFAGHTQSYNRYSYVMNNPLSFNDPSGYFLSKIFKALKKLIKKIVNIIKKVVKIIAKVVKKVVNFVKKYARVIVAVVVAVAIAMYAPQLLTSLGASANGALVSTTTAAGWGGAGTTFAVSTTTVLG